MRRGGRSGGQDGFLLVEALSTLVLSGLILAGLAAVLALMARAGDRATARAEGVEVSVGLLDALQRDLSRIARARWSGTDAGFVFDGAPDRILFARDAADPTQTRLVVLQSEPDERRLWRAEAVLPPHALGVADVALSPAQEIYSGATAITFRYAGSTVPGGPEEVFEAWPTAMALPSAVLVGAHDAAGAVTFEDRIALRVDAEPGCAATADAFCTQRVPEEEDDGG